MAKRRERIQLPVQSWAEVVALGLSACPEPQIVRGIGGPLTVEDAALIREVKPRPHQCYLNAMTLAMWSRGRLRYVEGVACGSIPHAWCVDASGRIVDPTLPGEPHAYDGLVLDADAVLRIWGKNGWMRLVLGPSVWGWTTPSSDRPK